MTQVLSYRAARFDNWRMIRRSGALILITALLAAGFYLGRPIAGQIQYLWSQRQLESFNIRSFGWFEHLPLYDTEAAHDYTPWFFIFVHGMRATNNPLRIVTVHSSEQGSPGQLNLEWETFSPATCRIGSRIVKLKSSWLSFPGDSNCMFPGQSDPIDQSHFTIGYQLNGKSDIIDGWLLPDDTVKLKPRNNRK